jgi:tyrosyl-tRNA synthetase
MSFAETIQLAQNFTVAQFLERDNFAKRLDRGDPIHLHEFLYAIMQGYDAVALKTDVQIGGTDQTFNILAGRRLQEAMGQKRQIMLTNALLPGTDGSLKMSKSLGNAIPISASPEEMYGRLMSMPDDTMRLYFDLLTDLSPAEIEQIFTDLSAGTVHPRDVKMRLARSITQTMHNAEAVAQAEDHFVTVFQQRELPAQMPNHCLTEPINIIDLLTRLGLARSKSEARRLIQQGGVRLNEKRVEDIEAIVDADGPSKVLRVGKRQFIELVTA